MKTVVISSGHSKYVSGAIGLVNEVEKARQITDTTVKILKGNSNLNTIGYHDDVSKTQKDNINNIVAKHNSYPTAKHYSVHLNSSGATTKAEIGVEVLYRFDEDRTRAEKLALALSKSVGLKNRGAKKRTNLGFLNKPGRLLIEAYFVNSKGDVEKLDEKHEVNAFCQAFADFVLSDLNIVKEHKSRVKTGTFKNLISAEKTLNKLKQIKGYPVKSLTIVYSDYGYIIQSGVFDSQHKAKEFADYIIKNKYVGKAHVIKV